MTAHWLSGAAISVVAWVVLRRSVHARILPWPALLLDAAAALTGWLAFLVLSARPIAAGLAIAALAIGLIVVDRVKGAVLREPVLFADRAELLELVRHPQLYLPFAGTGLVLSGGAAIAAVIAGLLLAEPAALPWTPLSLLLGPGIVVACLVVPTWPPLLRRLQRLYESLAPLRDPASDAARFGMLASFVIEATLARAERPARQAALRPRGTGVALGAETIVLLQSESFFAVERLHPGLGAAVQPAWTEILCTAVQHGRLAVPCWGANTIRSEFAVLAGVDESALGLDRFNPYAALARTPIESLVWQARAAGFRTVCVHPFDLGFYGRRHVLPQLGFERLIGPEAFTDAPRAGRYVSDAALARRVAAVLAEAPGRLLVFAISMECHGPWEGPARPTDSVVLPPALARGPEAAALAQFLFRLRAADAALPLLTAALRARPGAGVLAVYGDHQPSLPGAFAHAGLDDQATDYAIWRTDGAGGPARVDIAAAGLGAALLAAAR